MVHAKITNQKCHIKLLLLFVTTAIVDFFMNHSYKKVDTNTAQHSLKTMLMLTKKSRQKQKKTMVVKSTNKTKTQLARPQ